MKMDVSDMIIIDHTAESENDTTEAVEQGLLFLFLL